MLVFENKNCYSHINSRISSILYTYQAVFSTSNDTGECSHNSSYNSPGWGFESRSPWIGKIEKRFDWTDEQQGTILGAFFYGYITTQLLGGYLADRFGAKMLFGGGVACTAILTIVTEPVANWGFGWMVALRVIGNGL